MTQNKLKEERRFCTRNDERRNNGLTSSPGFIKLLSMESYGEELGGDFDSTGNNCGQFFFLVDSAKQRGCNI
ncbi:hypothetical protein YC2023_098308 [Brassica napus]